MACCSPRDHKELEMTERLNLTERWTKVFFQLFNWPTSANWLWFQPHFLESQKGECFLVILAFLSLYMKSWFPRLLRHKESACKCRRCGFNPWVEKILWRRKWKLTTVVLPGESHEQTITASYSPWIQSQTQLSNWACKHLKSNWVPMNSNWHINATKSNRPSRSDLFFIFEYLLPLE